MIRHYQAQFRVRSDDVGPWGDLPPRTLAAYLEQTARDASTDAGFDDPWYAAQGTAWIIRRLTLARFAPLRYQDSVAVTTWISQLGRVRSSRDYEVVGPAGTPAAAGRADWVYVDRARGAPRAIDRQLLASFEPGPHTPLLGAPPAADPLPVAGRVFTMPQRAYRYDADSLGHVNNTVYLAWLDEALADAGAVAGLPAAPAGGPGIRLHGTWYVVDYLRSALPGDPLTITSRLTGTGDGGRVLVWSQEIGRGVDVLLRCESRQTVLGDSPACPLAAVVAALGSPAPAGEPAPAG